MEGNGMKSVVCLAPYECPAVVWAGGPKQYAIQGAQKPDGIGCGLG